ncbi:MAG: nitrous oxide reductase accessory protein NosL, partial [Desulforhopalus sp.]
EFFRNRSLAEGEIMKIMVEALMICSLVISLTVMSRAGDVPDSRVNKESRCPVCGMFVAKYQEWITLVRLSNGEVETFDGVKDMMAFYHFPQQYGAPDGVTVEEIFVKDYYSLAWIDGRKAVYVTGSDVYGPMGHELIPFEKTAAAENFLKDHHGIKIVNFSALSPALIESLRKGHKMKNMQ